MANKGIRQSPKRARSICAAALSAAALLLAGCAAQQGGLVTVRMLSTQPYSPVNLVEVLRELPSVPYVRIAELDARAPAGTPSAQVLAELQNRAGALGANAIVVQDLSTEETGGLQYNPAGGQFTTTASEIVPHLRALAIRIQGKQIDN